MIRNLTPGPFDIESLHGIVRLPALESVSGEFDDDYLVLLEACGMVEIEALAELPSVTEQELQQPAEQHKRRRGRPRRGQQ